MSTPQSEVAGEQRFWLTPKAYAALARVTPHPGHDITLTPIGPAQQLECTCGLSRRFASGSPAKRAGLEHHHDTGGCNCPPHVVAHPIHPSPRQREVR